MLLLMLGVALADPVDPTVVANLAWKWEPGVQRRYRARLQEYTPWPWYFVGDDNQQARIIGIGVEAVFACEMGEPGKRGERTLWCTFEDVAVSAVPHEADAGKVAPVAVYFDERWTGNRVEVLTRPDGTVKRSDTHFPEVRGATHWKSEYLGALDGFPEAMVGACAVLPMGPVADASGAVSWAQSPGPLGERQDVRHRVTATEGAVATVELAPKRESRMQKVAGSYRFDTARGQLSELSYLSETRIELETTSSMLLAQLDCEAVDSEPVPLGGSREVAGLEIRTWE